MSEPQEEVKLKCPKHIFLILGMEFCERFCYYGLRTLLTLYSRNMLLFTDAESKVVFHTFTAFAYVFPVLGAVIADSWMGKFRTILYFSLVYLLGTLVLAVSAFRHLNVPETPLFLVGLALIAMGTGGIKPCVSAFGGDQYVLPKQQKLLESFFSFFYFCINGGSAFASFITPLLRDLRCFGEKSCYSAGFGLPSLFMGIALVLFVVGKPLYRIFIPQVNVVLLFIKCVGGGIKGKVVSKEKKDHWLDYSTEKYGETFVDHVKQSFQVVIIFFPIPFFWALFDQHGSSWTLQANLMNGDLGNGLVILPEQMITANPILILLLIPLFTLAIYPLLGKCNLLTTPLQRMTAGGIFAGLSFYLTAGVALAVEAYDPVLPSEGQSHLRIYNPLHCTAKIDALPYLENIEIGPMGYKLQEVEKVKNNNLVNYTITGCENYLKSSNGTNFAVNEKEMLGYFLSTNGFISFADDISKSLEGRPNVRTLIGNPQENMTITYKPKKETSDDVKVKDYSIASLDAGNYVMEGSDQILTFERGGVYTVLVFLEESKVKHLRVHETTKPNQIHMLWQMPQYILLTVGEVLLSPTGIGFTYTQSPPPLKSVISSLWLLQTSIGNLIVVILEAIGTFKKQSNAFFMYGTLMLIVMLIFAVLARRYNYKEYQDMAQDAKMTEEASASQKAN